MNNSTKRDEIQNNKLTGYKITIIIYTGVSILMLIKAIAILQLYIFEAFLLYAALFIPPVIMFILWIFAKIYQWNKIVNKRIYITSAILSSLYFIYGTFILLVIQLYMSEPY